MPGSIRPSPRRFVSGGSPGQLHGICVLVARRERNSAVSGFHASRLGQCGKGFQAPQELANFRGRARQLAVLVHEAEILAKPGPPAISFLAQHPSCRRSCAAARVFGAGMAAHNAAASTIFLNTPALTFFARYHVGTTSQMR